MIQREIYDIDRTFYKPFADLAPNVIKSEGRIDTPEMLELAESCGCVICGKTVYSIRRRPYNKEHLLLSRGEVIPEWFSYDASKDTFSINEGIMCEALKRSYHLHRVNGQFYNDNGIISDAEIKSRIQKSIMILFDNDIGRKTGKIFDALCNYCHTQPPTPREDRVFVKDGQAIGFFEKEDEPGHFTFRPVYEPDAFTFNRLDVVFDLSAECPTFEAFLRDLIHDEDMDALQEFCGYCLIPSTRAQTALFIKGNGGEGKSILTGIMCDIFKNSAVVDKLTMLEENRFKTANLENKLLFVDDDLNSELLKETGTIKQIITSSTPLTVEKKGQNAHEIRPYARIFCAGNTFIGAAFDRSDGLYRRLLLMECKPIPGGRTPDRFLIDKIRKEKSGILNWMLYGLQRLMNNGFEFTRSLRSQHLLEQKKLDDDPVSCFLRDETWVQYQDGFAASSTDLFSAFLLWCNANAVEPLSMRSAMRNIKQYLDRIESVAYSENFSFDGQRKRGYSGIGLTLAAIAKVRENEPKNLYKVK